MVRLEGRIQNNYKTELLLQCDEQSYSKNKQK